MLSKSFLKDQALKSPLASQSMINPKAGKGKKSVVFTLMLTSLIDAFSILVIFLLSSGSSSSQQLDMQGKIQLPHASHSDTLGMGTIVRVTDGRYFVNENPVSAQGLPQALYSITKKEDLIIQADRKIEFEVLNPIILAAQHAGFEKFKFVVLQNSAAKERVAVK